jgi:phosphate transport system permease protein
MKLDLDAQLKFIFGHAKSGTINKKVGKTSYPEYLIYASTLVAILVCAIFIYYIFSEALPTFQREGINFLLGTIWDYDSANFGALDFIVGTLMITIVALVIACPLSIMTALFLAEFAPPFVHKFLNPVIELLVGIPSVVYGFFGAVFLDGVFRASVKPFISSTLGFIPIFHNSAPVTGYSILLAGTILAIMILPTIAVVSQEAMRSVPAEYIEASLSLGATKWETVRNVVLRVSLSGIIAAVLLGTMRAMGETMAIVMLTGNYLQLPTSILDLTFSMTSKILLDIVYRFPDNTARSALMGLAAVLFIMEMLILIVTKAIGARLK